MEKEKGKPLGGKLTHFYIKNIKKWMFCPACQGTQNGRLIISKDKKVWHCNSCGYSLTDSEFADNYVFWFCDGDGCNAYLNNQEGFNRHASKNRCKNCGYENDTTFDNIKGICSDCGKIIPDSDKTLCNECKKQRIQKAKEWLITAGKVVLGTAAVVGTVCLAASAAGEEKSGSYPPTDDGDKEQIPNDDYPTCKSCGTKMTEFDGWAWYTCPFCGNSVRIIDGQVQWYDEIFKTGTKEHHSDFELADFCHGGELSED